MAKELINKKTSDFDPSRFTNHYAQALRALVDEKIKTGKVVSVDEDNEIAASSTVIDFMEALKKSVAQAGGGDKAPSKPGRKATSGSAAADAKPAERVTKTSAKGATAGKPQSAKSKASAPSTPARRQAAHKKAS